MAIRSAFDIGSNTVRLLVADLREGEAPEFLRREQQITRLAGGYDPETGLSPDAISRTLAALKELSDISCRYNPAELGAVGTEILRRAANRDEFLSLIKEQAGLSIRVISAEEEAGLTLSGVLEGVGGVRGYGLILDIGGASTELIFVNGETVLDISSLQLGAVRQTEKFLLSDPPTQAEIESLRGEVREMLNEPAKRGMELVGSAGAITCLAAIAQKMERYDRDKINGYVLSRQKVESMLAGFLDVELEQRKNIPGLPPQRADTIIGGAVILLEVMDVYGFDKMKVSDSGLLEGIVLKDRL